MTKEELYLILPHTALVWGWKREWKTQCRLTGLQTLNLSTVGTLSQPKQGAKATVVFVYFRKQQIYQLQAKLYSEQNKQKKKN